MSIYHQPPIGFISKVSIQVLNLQKAIDFYTNILGLSILNQDEHQAELTANGKDALLSIVQLRTGIKKQLRTTGLYHFA